MCFAVRFGTLAWAAIGLGCLALCAPAEAALENAAPATSELPSSIAGLAQFLQTPAGSSMKKEWQSQHAALQRDLGNRGHFARVAKEAFRREALILDSDRDPTDVVLRRTAALMKDLKRMLGVGYRPAEGHEQRIARLLALEQQLAALQAAATTVEPKQTAQRYALFEAACYLRRQIAFCNPLLDFSDIVFIKRHRPLYNHMCDQYYGMAARPGGGLYVLHDAFGPNPRVRDVLADSVVQNGRLRGQKLSGGPVNSPVMRFDGVGNLHGPQHEGGAFLSPDLSYDAKTLLFAYVECRGDQRHRHHTDPTRGHWDEGRCYHIFRVNVDGSDLRQLTDGTWNDFDPCWLPNGRIAFISERRGGYLRCGRVCPTYTLYDMAADGSDITALSVHETNEWHPSVAHDGRIIYTRWDYVDRHGVTAHMPWITTLDGRDSRALHGNFAPRHLRPDMELSCRAIPGSHKYVATAAPHHGQAYGSLIIIDPHVPDDDAMGPVRRLTPEVGFPESQGGAQIYGTPWPLAEDYYLCVYDPQVAGGTMEGRGYYRGDYGIYLVDSFGNKELLYRDPEIGCLSPIPLRPRPVPPVMPEMRRRTPLSDPAQRYALINRARRAEQSSADVAAPPGNGLIVAAVAAESVAVPESRTQPSNSPEGTVVVINVYESLRPWPADTKITGLRVLQVLPMSVPSGGPPHETGLRVASAGDSVVPVRYVLGTVPVEEDGSAHFVLPAHKEVFFQALDQRGLAVQSMRSATYLHDSERLVCIGCHEPKHQAPRVTGRVPLALRREPSRLKPDVDGSNPLSFPRLVQPILDKHCVDCHRENSDRAPSLAREPIVRNWYASYNTLVKYGFTDYGDSYRTQPGRFGARASSLYQMLENGHHGVDLSKEELHRIALWLDCVSMFYGVYEREGGQAQLRGQIAEPTLE